MRHIPSYPSVYALGHAALDGLLDGDVLIEEKVDGSQFSFGVIDGMLSARSKGKDLVMDAPERMFERAVETARALEPLLTPGWVYRGEYLQKPKHNTLAYSRVPEQHVILFDVMVGPETYADPETKRAEAKRLGLEVVPTFAAGRLDSLEALQEWCERESCLGGAMMEGVVVKNYARFGKDKKTLMGKYVREAFKEAHSREWKTANPTRADVVDSLIVGLKTEARWRKSVQHLRERGELRGSPQDIGPLLKEVQADIRKECEEEIKAALFHHAWPRIARAVVAGLPQWYKDDLAADQFPAPLSTGGASE